MNYYNPESIQPALLQLGRVMGGAFAFTTTGAVTFNQGINVSGVTILTTLQMTSGVSITAIVDDDTMAADSTNALMTKKSIPP